MADIVFISAPIGGGKSLLAVKLALQELKNGKRMVVTNLPFFIKTAPPNYMTVGEWCHKYCHEPVDLDARFRVLEEHEVFDFYRHYPGGFEMPEREQIGHKRHAKANKGPELLPDLSWRQQLQLDGVIPRGTLFIMDEIHLYFGAREWQTSGTSIEHYMSQLRKLNDDLYLVTQHPDKVDKNFRRNSTEWIHVQNMNKTRLFMGVTIKDKFRAHKFPIQPTRTDKPTHTASMSLMEDECAKTYDTMAGVGVMGKLSPESHKEKGRHWSVWLLLLIVIVGVAYAAPRLILFTAGKAISNMMGGFSAGFTKTLKSAVPALNHTNPVTPVEVLPVVVAPSSLNTPSGTNTETATNITVTGVVVQGNHFVIILSDGRHIRDGDKRFRAITEDYVNIGGMLYKYAKEGQTPDSASNSIP